MVIELYFTHCQDIMLLSIQGEHN